MHTIIHNEHTILIIIIFTFYLQISKACFHIYFFLYILSFHYFEIVKWGFEQQQLTQFPPRGSVKLFVIVIILRVNASEPVQAKG